MVNDRWIGGFEYPISFMQAETLWVSIKEKEAQLTQTLNDYLDLRSDRVFKLEEMQRGYTRHLGSSTVNQKINQKIAKMFATFKKLSKLTQSNLNKFYL